MRVFPLLALTLLATLSACKKDDDTGSPPSGTFIETNRDSSANLVPDYRIPAEVRILGFIAWDTSLQEIVPPILEGQDGFLSGYEIRLYEDGIDSPYCRVTIDLAGMTMSETAKGEGYAWGLDIPEGVKPGSFETCTNEGWDIEQFPEGYTPEELLTYDWHIRFYAPLSTELEDWLTPDNPSPDFDINHYTGGDWWSDTAPMSTDADSNYFYGWPMAAGGEVDRDNTDPLDARYTMVDQAGDMAQGYFVFDQRVYWNLRDE